MIFMPPKTTNPLDTLIDKSFDFKLALKFYPMLENMYDDHIFPKAEALPNFSSDLKSFREEILKFFPEDEDRDLDTHESIQRFTRETEALSGKHHRMHQQLEILSQQPEDIQKQLLQIVSLKQAASAVPNPLSYLYRDVPTSPYSHELIRMYEYSGYANADGMGKVLQQHIVSITHYYGEIMNTIDSASKVLKTHQNAKDLSATLDAEIQQLQQQKEALKNATSVITEDSALSDLALVLNNLTLSHPIASQATFLLRLIKQSDIVVKDSPYATDNQFANLYNGLSEHFQKSNPKGSSKVFNSPLLIGLAENSYIDKSTTTALNKKIVEMESNIRAIQQIQLWEKQGHTLEKMQDLFRKMPDPTITDEGVALDIALLNTINERKSAADAERHALTHPSPEGADSLFADVENTSFHNPIDLGYGHKVRVHVKKAYGADSPSMEHVKTLNAVTRNIKNNFEWIAWNHSNYFSKGYSEVAANSQKFRELDIKDTTKFIEKYGSPTLKTRNEALNGLTAVLDKNEKVLTTLPTSGNTLFNAARDASLAANHLLQTQIEAVQYFMALNICDSLDNRPSASESKASKSNPQVAPKAPITKSPPLPSVRPKATKPEVPEQTVPAQDPTPAAAAQPHPTETIDIFGSNRTIVAQPRIHVSLSSFKPQIQKTVQPSQNNPHAAKPPKDQANI